MSVTGAQAQSHSLTIPLPSRRVGLAGDLTLPGAPRGLVVFAHGSGSSRLSPRNRMVARTLQDAGFGTLLFDLLTPQEEAVDTISGQLRFDILFLAGRLEAVTEWITAQAFAQSLALGYFGASTGAAAALVASVRRPGRVAAIVSRGGRPDLAGPLLREVVAPTLLIVGAADTSVLRLNRTALASLGSREKEVAVVTGATHLFEEPGALERAAELAGGWFARHLSAR